MKHVIHKTAPINNNSADVIKSQRVLDADISRVKNVRKVAQKPNVNHRIVFTLKRKERQSKRAGSTGQ